MLHFTAQGSGKTCHLYKGQDLGTGRFGSVFTLVGAQGQATNLVAKIIDTHLFDPELSQLKRVRLAVNEIKVLNQLDLLEGYVREDAVYTIVMKEAKGLQTHLFHGNSVKWEMYRAIENLHRKNTLYYHKQAGDFLTDPNYNKLKNSLIDFGDVDDATFCNISIDHLTFFGRNFYSSPQLLSILSFYVSEMVAYAMESQFETCIQLHLVATFTLSALYGIAPLVVTHIMVREFIITLLWGQLSKEINAESIEELIYLILSKQYKSRNILDILKKIVVIVESTLAPYLIGSLLSYQWLKEGGSFVPQNFQCLKDKGWQSLFSNVTPGLICTTAMMYFPIAELIATLQKNVEEASSQRSSRSGLDILYHYHAGLY